MLNPKKYPQTIVRYNYMKLENFKTSGQLNLQESRECNWMSNIGDILKIDIVMTVTTHTIKKGNHM